MDEKMNWIIFVVDIHNHKVMNENVNCYIINKDFVDEEKK